MKIKQIALKLDKWFVIFLYSSLGAGCWSFLIAGVCGKVFNLGDNAAMGYVGIPLFLVLLVWFFRLLPKHLRKAGLLRDD